MKGRIKSLYRQSSEGYSYRIDPLEIRGVFRGFFAKNTRGTAFVPFGSEFSMGERKLLHCEAMIPPFEGRVTGYSVNEQETIAGNNLAGNNLYGNNLYQKNL